MKMVTNFIPVAFIILVGLLLGGCEGGGGTSIGGPVIGGGSTSSNVPAGVYTGTAGSGEARNYLAVNMDTSATQKTFFWLYSASGGLVATSADGFLSGMLQIDSSTKGLSASSMTNYDLAGSNISTSSASLDSGSSYSDNDLYINLTQDGSAISNMNLTLVNLASVSLVDMEGTVYTGSSNSDTGNYPTVSLTMDATNPGDFSGTDTGGCSFTGHLSASSLDGVFTATVHPNGGVDSGTCMGNPSLIETGIAVKNGSTLYLAVANLTSTAAVFVGTL